MKPAYKTKKTCRICGSKKLVPILDLGAMPPANAFLKKSTFRHERSFPLRLIFCPRCTLVQLREVVNPATLFGKYAYLSSASSPLVEHFADYAKQTQRRLRLQKKDLVADIGSNDGVLLSNFKSTCRILGVDPAANVAAAARRAGVPTVTGFFTPPLAKRLRKKHGAAKAVFANNVFAHIDNIHEVLDGIKVLLAEDGVFISESHWVGNLLGKGGFDQIYHEHLCYFSLHALVYLARTHGLRVIDVELVPMHGESMRVYMAAHGLPSARVKRLLAREKARGLTRVSTFRVFKNKIERKRAELRQLLRSLRRQGKLIVGYGAPAKGNTLLNYYGLGTETLDYLTDTTPLKQRLYSPGMHIPIVSPDRLKTDTPDYILLLAWNFKDAILEKEKALRRQGVKFIVTVPRVEVV